MVYWTPGFKEVYQDMWFMGDLVSRKYSRICGLWDTWFQGIPGYWVYGRPGFKVNQNMCFMGNLVFKVYQNIGFMEDLVSK